MTHILVHPISTRPRLVARFRAFWLALLCVLCVGRPSFAQAEDPTWNKLMNAADARHADGQFEDSLKLGKAAEQRARQLRNGTYIALSLLSEAQNLQTLMRYAETARVLEEALQLSRQAFGDRSGEVATVLNNLSNLYFIQNQMERAAGYLEQAIAIARANNDLPALATNLGNAGWLQINLRDFAKASAAVEQSIRIFEQLKQTKELPHQLRTLSIIHDATGQSSLAEKDIRRALSIDEATLGARNLATAADHCQLAALLRGAARFDDSLQRYDVCLSMREELLKAQDPRYGMVAETLDGIAETYAAAGSPEKAVPMYERARAITISKFGPNTIESALAGVRLAGAYFDLDDIQKTVQLLGPSTELLRKLNANDKTLEEPLRLLGHVLMKAKTQDGYAKARNAYRALAEQELKAGALPAYGVTLHSVGAACVKLNDRACAFEALNKALENRRQLYPEPSLKAAASHLMLAGASYWFKDYAAAEKEYANAFEQWKRLGYATADSPFSEIDTNLYVDTLWRLHGGAKPSADAQALGFEVAQLAHQSQAGQALAQLAARMATGTSESAALMRREQDLSKARTKLQGEYGDLLGAQNDADRARKLQNLRTQIATIETEHSAASAALAARMPAYRALAVQPSLPAKAVQGLLREQEALVAFNFGGQGAFAWGVTKSTLSWTKLAEPLTQITSDVQLLRRGLDGSPAQANKRGLVLERSGGGLPFDLNRAHALYKTLFGSLGSPINKAKHLLFVPSGPLESIPPSVLVTKPPKSQYGNFDELRSTAWLVRDMAITIVPAVSALRRPTTTPRTATKAFFGLGEPAVEQFSSLASCPAPGMKQEASALSSLTPLPKSGSELTRIAQSLGSNPDSVYLKERATEDTLTKVGIGDYRVLAFATHGLVAGEAPGVNEPALVVTPPKSCVRDGGLLTASKVAQLNLGADWVVLSACNTAAGDNSASAQGLSGLARAFFYAGAHSLLVSHWSVQDEAAIALTTGTFAELSQHPTLERAEALRRATLAAMSSKTNPQASHPSYWAPFVFVGGGDLAQRK